MPVVAGFCFLSCTDEYEMIYKKTLTEDSIERGYDTYLSFADTTEFFSMVESLKTMDSASVREWENQRGFISLSTIGDMIDSAEDAFIDSLMLIYPNPDDYTGETHSEVFHQFADVFLHLM